MKLDLQFFGGRGATTRRFLGRTKEQDSTLRSIGKRTANLKKEQYRIVDSNGNVLLTKQGKQGEVATTVGEKREYLEGNISIHNHPDGGTFSSADFSDFGYGAKEIVASTPEGQYRLINTNYGTSKAKSTWVDFRDAYEKGVGEMSFAELNRRAKDNLANSHEAKMMERISNKWVEARKRGESQAVQDKLYSEYTKYQEAYKEKFKKERRRLEVQPNHEWIKANAKKYGFKYVLETR